MFSPLTSAERARLVAAHAAACRGHEEAANRAGSAIPWSDAEAEARAEAEKAFRALQAAETAYFDALPRLAFGCCPFDGRPLMRSIDPFGLEGPWWQGDAASVEVPACPHFCCITGVVAVGNGTARDARHGAFVLGRLLSHEGMVAVAATRELDSGVRVITVAYFAERRPVPEALTANWPRPVYHYTTQQLVHAWSVPSELADRNLMPWLETGKLRWCDPDLEPLRLSDAPAGRFPFAAFGAREPGSSGPSD